MSPPRLAVTATFPQGGETFEMDTTRPGDVPEVGDKGWPALVRIIKLATQKGELLSLTAVGAEGWKLPANNQELLTLTYEVDYSGVAKSGWPAARELGFEDAQNIVLIGRSVFVASNNMRESKVTFDLPEGWRPIAPWSRAGRSRVEFAVPDVQQLQTNLLVVTKQQPTVISSNGFNVSVTHMGYWNNVKSEVAHVVRGVVQSYVRLMGSTAGSEYSIVLLPFVDVGAESYPRSFAYNGSEVPTRANRLEWGHLIAHEMFHHWNGWQLRGGDYASSQWFQEGFTEYAAEMAIARAGLMTTDEFCTRLSKYISRYRLLTTPLDAPGNRKGAPLYSGGALAAFCWDVELREATGSQKNLGDAFKALWTSTRQGKDPYTWKEIEAALAKTASHDWNGFYARHIHGKEPLPIDAALEKLGLRNQSGDASQPSVAVIDNASTEQRTALAKIMRGW